DVVEVSPDSTKMLFMLEDGTMGTADLKTLLVTATWQNGSEIDVLGRKFESAILTGGFLNDRQFVNVSNDGYFRLWNIGDPKPARVINIDPGYFYSFVVSPDKKYIVAVDFEKIVHFINIATGQTDFRFFATD